MNKKLIVISVDAMIYEDLDYAGQLPAFRYLLENGARVNRLRSVYPTLTYPCHTTMITGCYPDRHGVCNNEAQVPGDVHPPWLWDHSAVQCADLMDACKAAGYTTASLSWPCTGNHPHVDYLLDEIWPIPIPADPQAARAAFRRCLLDSGTSETLFREVVEPYLDLRIRRAQPDTSWFVTKICADILRKYRPDVMTVHTGNVDNYRHAGGVHSPKICRGLEEADRMIAEILNAAKDAGTFAQTDFVVTADHGQIDVDRTAKINILLRDLGFIRPDAADRIPQWDAWCFDAGTSAQIRLRDPSDTALRDQVERALRARMAQGDCGYSSIYTAEEAESKERLRGSFSFVLETDGHTCFSADTTGDYFEPVPGGVAGSHGYHPDHGPCPPMLCCGSSFRRGVVLETANLVDGAPTYAKLLGVRLPEADGHALDALLNPC